MAYNFRNLSSSDSDSEPESNNAVRSVVRKIGKKNNLKLNLADFPDRAKGQQLERKEKIGRKAVARNAYAVNGT